MTNAEVRRLLRRGLLTSGLGALGVLLVLIVVSRSDIGAEALVDLRARARLGPLLLATVVVGAAFLCLGNRWRVLLPPGFRPPVFGLTAMLSAGLLLNYALPGPLGELGAAWFAHRRYQIPMADALASGMAARVVGLASAALLATAAWALTSLPVPPAYRSLVASVAVLIGIGGALLVTLAAFPRPWQRLATRVLGLRPTSLAPLALRAERLVLAITEAMARTATLGPLPYARATFWSVAGHLAVSAGIGIAAASLGVHPDPIGLVFAYTLPTAGAIVLFALPGSQVSWDVGFIALLVGTCGLALPDALALGAIVRIQQVLIQGIGAVAMGWLLGGAEGIPDTIPSVLADSNQDP